LKKTKERGSFLKNFIPQSYIWSSQPRLQLTATHKRSKKPTAMPILSTNF